MNPGDQERRDAARASLVGIFFVILVLFTFAFVTMSGIFTPFFHLVVLVAGSAVGALAGAQCRPAWTTAMITFLVFFNLFVCVDPIFSAHLIQQHLLVGWFLFLVRVVPIVQVDPAALLVGLVVLAALIGGIHWLGTSMVNRPETEFVPARSWKPRWTFGIVAVVALMFTTGLTAIGIVACVQSLWEIRR